MSLPFALLGHPTGVPHIEAVVGRRLPARALLLKMLEWAPPFVMSEFELRSNSATASGLYITCPFLPESLSSQPFGCLAKVREACRLAERRGARLVCLGGFTSIAARRGSSDLCLPYTTGSSLTAALAVAACQEAAQLTGLDLAVATVAIIGGLGEIGQACARALAGHVGRLLLTSRRPKRSRLGPELRGVELGADNALAAAEADVVIAAAASPAPLLGTSQLRPGAIVCDVGYPPNVADDGRPDVIVFRGGLARTPHPLDFGFDTGLPSPGLTYGCFAEAMLMALEGDPGLRGSRLLAAFERHGFTPAGLWRGGRQVGAAELVRAAAARLPQRGHRWI